jgi:hypothetical protein
LVTHCETYKYEVSAIYCFEALADVAKMLSRCVNRIKARGTDKRSRQFIKALFVRVHDGASMSVPFTCVCNRCKPCIQSAHTVLPMPPALGLSEDPAAHEPSVSPAIVLGNLHEVHINVIDCTQPQRACVASTIHVSTPGPMLSEDPIMPLLVWSEDPSSCHLLHPHNQGKANCAAMTEAEFPSLHPTQPTSQRSSHLQPACLKSGKGKREGGRGKETHTC